MVSQKKARYATPTYKTERRTTIDRRKLVTPVDQQNILEQTILRTVQALTENTINKKIVENIETLSQKLDRLENKINQLKEETLDPIKNKVEIIEQEVQEPEEQIW